MTAKMNHEISIDAPKRVTWSAIADEFGEVYKYSPNITYSRLMGETRSAVGMTRRCEFSGNQYVVEKITHWEDGQSFSFEATEISLPMKTLRSRWTVSGDDRQSLLHVETVWEPKGLLGFVMKPLMKRRLTSGLAQALDDMRKELEGRASSSTVSGTPVSGEPQFGTA